MAKKSIAERIAQLDSRKKALQSRLSKQERADDTRRKVLLGALILHQIESDREFGVTLRNFVKRELPGFLSRDADKALFAGVLGNENPEMIVAVPSIASDDESDGHRGVEDRSSPAQTGVTTRRDAVDI